ncbi:arabinose isomerase [Mucilaginibacter sp. 14171R-50]|uniref:arabinose isomerase n=1 Tax=Mucilaginibacter sp. 14171R-50 TaxID=2703789 RepID=UPI00138C41D5|nr:arabinose isomerase [Mucilaginibacter sp. 14171R-50]QHS56488.1 arabinose isomerase [Mucilaginibacter sp. 14171R-50]
MENLESKKTAFKIGLFGIGLNTYWDQFPGLKDRLLGYIQTVSEHLGRFQAEVLNVGLIDDVQMAFQAGTDFRRADVEMIFLYATTYALSSTVLPVIRKLKVPVVMLNLSPGAAIDYGAFNRLPDRSSMTAEWLAHCGSCPVPEVVSVLKSAGVPFYQITGTLDDEQVWKKAGEWIEAARVAHVMSRNVLGLMGNYYPGMLDIYSNLRLHCATFGGHIEIIEVDELSKIREFVTDADVKAKMAGFETAFDIKPDCPAAELTRAAATAVALDRLVEKYGLGSLAYYHKGLGVPANENTMSSIILGTSMLTANGVPVAGEYEVKNVQAMKIMDIFGAGGSFTEYYAMDFNDNVVIMGHDGPCHPKIAEGKVKVKPLDIYHGKVGRGLSVEMSVAHGKVTLLSVVETPENKLLFLVAEAESVPGPILEIGNTNSRYRFPVDAGLFMEKWNEQGPAHHCAIGRGHIASKIQKLGNLLGIKTVVIC